MHTTSASDSARGFTRTPVFEALARAGYVARGAIYLLIGLLALRLAQGVDQEAANQQGALRTVAQQPFGQWLLALMAVGLAGYAIWRLLMAGVGDTPEAGHHSAMDRLGALGSGLSYAVLCVAAVTFLLGDAPRSGGQRQATAGVFDWPAGRYLVGLVGLVFLGMAAYQAYQGLSRKFRDDSKVVQMEEPVRKTYTIVGTVGLCARAVAFALIGFFVLKAAIEFDPKEAKGLDGALASLLDEPYGPVLLAVVAIGLMAFGVYSLFDAKYRKI